MAEPDKFHPEAHPQAREITGNRKYGEWGQCIAQARSADRRCRGYAKGAHGKCYNHGGSTPTKDENPNVGNGDQEDNTNAVRHAMFVEASRFYRKIADNLDRRLIDDIYHDYVDVYRETNASAPTVGDLKTMWDIAVEQVQISHADNWLADKPEELDSGNPVVDREVHYTDQGQEYYRYKEAVTVRTKLKLRKEHRQWLKANNMLNDPDSQQATAMSDFKDAWIQRASRGASDAGTGGGAGGGGGNS